MASLLTSLFATERLIGIDLGSSNIKIIQAEALKDRIRIVKAVQTPTPAGAIKEGYVMDREAVAAALRELLRTSGISASGATIAVSGQSVVVRRYQKPRMSEAELRKSARYDVTKYVTSSIEETAFAVKILGASETEPGHMDVMLVAAPREMVESRIAAVESAGIDVVAVDLEAFALQRAVVDCRRSMWDDGKLRALVDIGAAHTEVTLLQGATFALTRSITIAGDAFTETLRARLGGDTEAAEARKRDVDLRVLIDGGSDQEVAVARALQATTDELLREIRRSINYYQAQIAEAVEAEALAEIVLSGGSSQMNGIAPYIEARLTTPTRIASAMTNPVFGAVGGAEPTADGPLDLALGLSIKEFVTGPLADKF